MKKLSVIIIGLALIACGETNNTETDTTTTSKDSVEVSGFTGDMILNDSMSGLNWTGEKPTDKHTGTVNFSGGKLLFENGNLTAGKFEVDMTSLTNSDIESEEYRAKLIGHLMSADFFSVDSFPTALYSFDEVVQNEDGTCIVTGDLTIKGITNTAEITVSEMEVSEEGFHAHANFTIDRTLWNVRYGSNKFFDDLVDKAISDEVAFEAHIVAN